MLKTAIILAGGLGTRLRPVVQEVPKPMAPIHGRPFLGYQMDYWIKQGIERFILSVGYKHEVISNFFGHRYHEAEIDYAIESTPLGTGGGLLLALNQFPLTSPFLLLNGDTYFDVDITQLSQFAVTNQADWVFSLVKTDNPARYMSIDVSPNGRISSFGAEIMKQHRCLANGGAYWVNPQSLSGQQMTQWSNRLTSLENDIFPTILSAGKRLFGMECSGEFIDIGLPDDYYRSESILIRT